MLGYRICLAAACGVIDVAGDIIPCGSKVKVLWPIIGFLELFELSTNLVGCSFRNNIMLEASPFHGLHVTVR